jgi:putative sugar O-methyltransferase
MHALRAIFGNALEVVIVDLPMALYHSAVYLNAVSNGAGFHLALPGTQIPERFSYLVVANYLLDECEDRLGPIDMAINTMSFQEMSVEQVSTYARLFDRLLRPDGIVFDENENSALLSHHIDSCQILEEVFPAWNRIESGTLMIERKCRVWRKSA